MASGKSRPSRDKKRGNEGEKQGRVTSHLINRAEREMTSKKKKSVIHHNAVESSTKN